MKTITTQDVLDLRSLAPSLAPLCDRALQGQQDAWYLVREMLARDVRHGVYVHHATGTSLRLVGDRSSLVAALQLAREYLGADAVAVQVVGPDATQPTWVKRYSTVETSAEQNYPPTTETRNEAKARRARARRTARRDA